MVMMAWHKTATATSDLADRNEPHTRFPSSGGAFNDNGLGIGRNKTTPINLLGCESLLKLAKNRRWL